MHVLISSPIDIKFLRTNLWSSYKIKWSQLIKHLMLLFFYSMVVQLCSKVFKTRKTRSLAIAGVSPFHCTVLMPEQNLFLDYENHIVLV
jgi:hypothetical protein